MWMPWTHSMLFRASISLFFLISEFSGRLEEDRNKPLTCQIGLISQRIISEIITQSRSEFGSNCLRKHTAVINIVQVKQSCQVLFLTETQFTYHKIHPFKVYNYMVFNIVLKVCNYHYYLVPQYFCHPPSLPHKETPYPWAVTPHFSTPSPWNFVYMEANSVFFCEIHPCCTLNQYFIPLCGWIIFYSMGLSGGFPGGSESKESAFNAGMVGKIPWRRKWQPTPVFLPGKSHGQRSLVGYSPRGCKESDMTKQLTHTWVYHRLVIHSSVNGHLGCVHFLAIINNAVKNICV